MAIKPITKSMRAIITLFLMSPAVACAFFNDVEYKKTDPCYKLKSSYGEASIESFSSLSNTEDDDLHNQAMAYLKKSVEYSNYGNMKAAKIYKLKGDKAISEAVKLRKKQTFMLILTSNVQFKALNDALKYQCFKQTPACIESVKALATEVKRMADSAKRALNRDFPTPDPANLPSYGVKLLFTVRKNCKRDKNPEEISI